jgi:1-acyl-sn-glycerol-3-phosphate acyltransferase
MFSLFGSARKCAMSSIDRPAVRRAPDMNIVFHMFARLCFWLAGWKVVGGLPDFSKMVVLGAPHTSNVDGIILLLASWLIRVRIDWVVKAELTRGPLGWIIKAMGGVSVDRSINSNTVDQIVEEFNRREKMVLVIAPEGTRRKGDHWKTGFYWIAVKSGVPLVFGRLNYREKVVDLTAPFMIPGGDIETDMQQIWALYQDVTTARFPERVNDLRLRSTNQADE